MLKNRQLWLSLTLLLLASGLNFVVSALIQLYFPDRQPIPDTLFIVTPYVDWTQYLTDLANIFSFVLVGFYVARGHREELPFILAVFGTAYLMRAFIILLNPFGGPLGNIVTYGLTTIHQHGQFPSGHTLMVVVSYLVVNAKKAPLIKRLLLGSVIVEMVSLILSRGHYGIDVLGGFFVAYVAYNELIKSDRSLRPLDN